MCNKCSISFMLLFSFLLSIKTVFAKDPEGQITGSVVTIDGIPAAAVTIQVNGTGISAITREDGSFTIKHIAAGSYQLQVLAIGYEEALQNIVVEHNKNTQVVIRLKVSYSTLQNIIVQSFKNKLAIQQSEYAAKMPLKNLENAQATTTISKELMQQQVNISMDDALKNVPGITKKFEATGLASSNGAFYSLRGFSVQSGFRNGLTARFGAGVDNANLKSIEVIKGPSATLFGSSLTSYGGLINRITKQPQDVKSGELSYTAGSYGLNRITADYNTPLDSAHDALFRINAAWQNENSFKDNGFRKSIFIAPSFSYRVNGRLTVLFDAEFSNVQIGGGMYSTVSFINSSVMRSLFGIPANSGINLSIPKIYGINNIDQLKMKYNLSYASNDLTMNNQTSNLFAQATYRLAPGWTSYTNVSTNTSRSSGYQPYLFILPDAIAARSLSVSGYSNAIRMINEPVVQQNAAEIQENITGDFNIGTLRNRFVGGLDFYHNSYQQDPNSYYGKVLGITYESLFDIVPLSGSVPGYNNFNKSKVDSLQAAQGKRI
jgi:iron complex outermembrane receptor protein